jgi:hypothetical protein
MNNLLVLCICLVVAAGEGLASAESAKQTVHSSFRVLEAADCGKPGIESMRLDGTSERCCFERTAIADETQK